MLTLGWVAFSVAYFFLALVLVAILFGREANDEHLLGLAVAFAVWVALSLSAVRALRAPKGG